jgi:hypothetical protein
MEEKFVHSGHPSHQFDVQGSCRDAWVGVLDR